MRSEILRLSKGLAALLAGERSHINVSPHMGYHMMTHAALAVVALIFAEAPEAGSTIAVICCVTDVVLTEMLLCKRQLCQNSSGNARLT